MKSGETGAARDESIRDDARERARRRAHVRKDLRPGAEPATVLKSLLSLDWRRALIVGAITAAFALLGSITVGSIGDATALSLLETIRPTTRFLGFAAITAPGTILALLLTMLSFSRGWDHSFRSEYYDRIRQVALLCTLSITGAVFLLLFLNVPISESQELQSWYEAFYYGVVIWTSLLGGTVITIMFILHTTIVDLICVLDPHVDASSLFDGDD